MEHLIRPPSCLCAVALMVAMEMMVAMTTSVHGVELDVDSNGYIAYCPCMGKSVF